MRVYTFFSFCCMFAAFVSALPYASPVEDSEFDMGLYLEDLIEENGLQEYFDGLYQNDGIHKRNEQTIEKVLLLVNNSGIIWEALDAVAGHPSRIQFLANQTGKLLNSSGGSLDMSALTSGVNATQLLNIVKDSGLLTSVLDGILLDDDYRPVLTDLIERVVRPNMFIISYLIHDVFQKSNIQKRADYSGSLASFAENALATVLGSKIFTNTFADIVNALNDTGVAVYTIKRFIADESYQNMTASLVKEIYDTGAIKFSGSLNITALVGTAVSNPKAITNLIGKVLSGNLNLGSSLGKYSGAVKKIIKDLEDDGLFAELNEEVFPSSSTKASSTKSVSQTKKEKILATSTSKTSSKKATALYMYGNNKENSPTSSSDSGSISLQQNSNIPIVKCLIYVQTLIFGGALLLI